MASKEQSVAILSHTYIFTWLEAIKKLAEDKVITGDKAQLIAKSVLEKALEYLNEGKIKDYKEFIVKYGQDDKNAINQLIKSGLKANFLDAVEKEAQNDNSNFWE